MYGADEQQHVGRGHQQRSYQYGYTRGFEADVTAEELFNMFFGGGAFQQQGFYTTRRARFHRASNQEREVNSNFS